MNRKNGLGEGGSLWNYPDTDIAKPCDKCTIIGLNAGLEYTDGRNANIDTQAWLKSSPESMPITRRLMREMIEVANRCGVPVGFDLVDNLIDRILSMPGIYSSMHTDMKEGRPLEVEVILGTPVKKARELGMDVPVLNAVYALTNAVDWRLRQSKL